MAEVDIAIVGGGPAGQAAALQLAGSRLSVAVFDEQPRPGGQILRQPPASFTAPGWGNAYRALKAQLAAFEALPVDWRGGRSVLGIARDGDAFAVTTLTATGCEVSRASRVLVAAGCQDIAVPLPGWTLPGVMAAGGLQAFVKAQRIIPGARVVLAGTHPLMLLIADQIAAAGGKVAAVLFAQPRSTFARAVTARPVTATRGAPNLLAAAAAWRRLRNAGVPVHFGADLAAIEGSVRVEAAVLTDGERIACDTVGLCYGFVPQSDLVRAAGVAVRPPQPGGWAALHDEWLETSVPGLFVAGETTGVAGAVAAAIGGRIAGLGLARSLGVSVTSDIAALRRDRQRALDFAALLDAVADPRRYWPVVAPGTIACRCEDVRIGDLAAALQHAGTANAVKLATRCGMGLCQGRNCEATLLRMLPPGDPGFTARFPARPVAVSDLIG